MIDLYQIAIDATIDTDIRYAALKLMQQKQEEFPANYLRRWKRALKAKRHRRKHELRSVYNQ
jgi:hypothetical protein